MKFCKLHTCLTYIFVHTKQKYINCHYSNAPRLFALKEDSLNQSMNKKIINERTKR